jgi:hypothetical protein
MAGGADGGEMQFEGQEVDRELDRLLVEPDPLVAGIAASAAMGLVAAAGAASVVGSEGAVGVAGAVGAVAGDGAGAPGEESDAALGQGGGAGPGPGAELRGGRSWSWRLGSRPDPGAELSLARPRVGLGDPALSGGFAGRVAERYGPWVRSLGFCAVLVSLVAVVVTVLAANDLRNTTWNDTYRYVTAIERDLGKSPAQAQAVALQYYCSDLSRTADSQDSDAQKAQITSTCVSYWTKQGGLVPNTSRFNLIFDSRPGYPMMAAPFVAALGVNRGLAVLSLLLTLLAGWGVVVLIRVAGGGTRAALAGMIACFTLPTWYWLGQFLTEAPTLVMTIGALIGAVLLLRGAVRSGLIVSAVFYTLGFIVRYSNFSMLALCMMITVGVLAVTTPYWRNRRAALLGGFSAVVFAITMVLPVAFGWPGFSDSVEDTFTDHYTKPVPPDMYGKLLSLNYHYWIDTGKGFVSAPLVPGLVVLGAFMLWRYRRAFGAVVGAAALTGLGTAAAHPLVSQLDRLYFLIYLLAVCGLPIAADLAWPRSRPQVGQAAPAGSDAQIMADGSEAGGVGVGSGVRSESGIGSHNKADLLNA